MTSSGDLKAPEQFLHIPGGPLKTASYNITEDVDDMTTKSFILQSTYFQYMTNLSGIYYVPATAGEIIIDVREKNHYAANINSKYLDCDTRVSTTA